MKLGIKVDYRNGIEVLRQSEAKYCEVWFRVDETEKYTDLFSYIQDNSIKAGLHFWGMLKSGDQPNIAYPDKSVARESNNLIKKTIEIALRQNFTYVNIHPGARQLAKIDFQNRCFIPYGKPASLADSERILMKNMSALNKFAVKNNILLLAETLPAATPKTWYQNRSETINIHEMPIESVIRLAKAGFNITNDFGHTAAAIITDDKNEIWRHLYNKTQELLPQTRVIHLGYVLPPYNGTDCHGSFYKGELDNSEAIPNKGQLIELLKLFPKEEDIWIIPEPSAGHVQNYRFLRNFFSREKLLT